MPQDNLTPYTFPQFSVTSTLNAESEPGLNAEDEVVELPLNIELGRTRLDQEVLATLRQGSVVPLDKSAGRSMDVYADGRLVARGELLVLDNKFCIRITERLIHEDLD